MMPLGIGRHIIELGEQMASSHLLDRWLASRASSVIVVQSLYKEVVPMSVESLLLQNVLEKYLHLPMAEERRSFLAYN